MKARLSKPTPLDYVVMIGGPLIFVVIAILGIRTLLGPPPPVDPIGSIRTGSVHAGQRFSDVEDNLGKPDEVKTADDGSLTLIFRRTAYDENTKSLVQDEATVQVSPSGRITAASVDRLTPPAAGG